MKRYKRILPSTLVLITLMSSITTEDTFATTRAEYVNSDTDAEVNSDVTTSEEIELTTGSAIRATSSAALRVRAAGTTYTENGWTFEYDTATLIAKITAASGKTGDVVVPSSVTINGNDYTVNEINPIFRTNNDITSVVLPESITDIGKEAFYKCENLEKITMKGAIKNIPPNTFQGCVKLEEVIFSEGLEMISGHSFRDCTNLKYVDLPSTVVQIAESAFQDCKSLKNIKINGSINILGNYAFSGCESLEEIVFQEGLETINMGTFQNCKSLTKVGLPSSAKVIFQGAFSGCTELKEINLSDELIFIDAYVFAGSGLRYIHIPDTTQSLVPVFISSVVSSDTNEPITTAYIDVPLTGSEIPIDVINPGDVIGKTIYMKYNIAITPNEINLNGGELVNNSTITFPAWMTDEELSDYLINKTTLGKPKRDGQTFDKWEVVSAYKITIANGSKCIVSDVKIKAKWVDKNAIFNADNGTDKITISQKFGENFVLPETVPAKDGYTFLGWFDGDNEITSGAVVGDLKDGIEYIARWEKMVKKNQ